MFEKDGLKDNWPIYCSVFVTLAQLAMSFFVMLFVDRLGRKTMLLMSLIGMCVSGLGLSVFGIVSVKAGEGVWNYVIVGCVVSYICSFGLGAGN